VKVISELAEKNRLPVIYPFNQFVEAGGLMSYGVDVAELGHHGAAMVGRILKGVKPGEIPVFLPIKFRTGHQSQDGEGARPHRAA
jgi:putative tryptophan/tyrosine transport system substrate-binding protein